MERSGDIRRNQKKLENPRRDGETEVKDQRSEANLLVLLARTQKIEWYERDVGGAVVET
jgi:hypothetical protein